MVLRRQETSRTGSYFKGSIEARELANRGEKGALLVSSDFLHEVVRIFQVQVFFGGTRERKRTNRGREYPDQEAGLIGIAYC